jgi:transposase
MTDLYPASGAKTVILEDGIRVQETKSYGIGIDCHSKFIQVCILTKHGIHFYAHQKEFSTGWDSLVSAKDWCIRVLQEKSDPVPDLTRPLHYCIESTSTYHQPILLAFGGTPSIVNPTLAGATKRKTDVLDAQLLATHDLIGVWRESYIPSPDINELRVLVWERDRCLMESTAASRRINNTLVRFGYTVGRDGSVSKNGAVRETVEAILDGEVGLPGGLCPLGIPPDAREVVISEYRKYDQLRSLSDYWRARAEDKVCSMEWETGAGTLPGTEMLSLLMTAPQVGTLTAVTWLVHIITPRRFPNAKAVAAYCGLDPSLKVSAKHVTSTRKRGGNKELHKALVSSADRLIRNHTEMFGRWGYNLYSQTGKWKKASNAVARKLAVAMYYMMLTGQPFSYENYNLVKNLHVLEIPVSELPSIEPDFKRYVRILEEHGITTTSQLVTAYLSCSLGSCRGLGKKFFSVLRIFLNEQHKYKRIYKELHSNQTQTKEESNNEQQIHPKQPE